MPKIGAHISAAGSLDLSLDRAKAIGAEVSQIFISPPQQWAQTEHKDKEIGEYKKKAQELGIGPNFIHGTYLINLGTQNPEHLKKSIDWLIYGLNLADKLNCRGVIFHTGSHKGEGIETVLDQVVSSIKKVLDKSINSFLILENSASKSGIGNTFSELGQILKGVGNTSTPLSASRLKVCLDTQHSYAAGYDVKSSTGLKEVLEEFDREVGLENLIAVHANDSKFDFKSGRDRHENIGEGFIGQSGFKNIINNPKLKDIPFLLEVPGFTDSGPDQKNIAILKSLIK